MTHTICRQIDALANPEHVVGVLIGLGHYELADRLQSAAQNAASAKSHYYTTEQVEPFVGEFSSAEADAANSKAWDAWMEAKGALVEAERAVEDLRRAMTDSLPVGAWEDYLGV